MSNFEKVIEFNKAFGIFVTDISFEDIFDSKPQLVKLRYDLIAEEIRELNEDGFNARNFVEVIDALTDILYVVYGAGASFGINLDYNFEIYSYLKMSHNLDKNISNFNRIKFINNDYPDKIMSNVFDNETYTEFIRAKYVSVMNKELNSLKRYINKEDFVKVSNSLVKILDYTYSLGCSLGIDLDRSFDIVHQSNMSKLCIDEAEAKATVNWYDKNETRYDSPTYRPCLEKTGSYVIFNKSTGKILKSINYKPANFESMMS